MINIFLLPFLIITLLTGSISEKADYIELNSTFDDTQYSKHNFRTFAKIPSANQLIDLNNIQYDLLNAAVFFATNRQRELHKLPQFSFNPLLRDAAKLHTDQMVKHNFFAHQNPKNNKLRSLKERLLNAGAEGKYLAAGENISEYFLFNYSPDMYYTIKVRNGKKVFINPKNDQVIESHTYLSFGEAIVRDWMGSAGHRANILQATFTHLGCSGRSSTPLEAFAKAKVTQVFGAMK